MAKYLGVSREAVNSYENCSYAPGVDVALLLVSYFDISDEELEMTEEELVISRRRAKLDKIKKHLSDPKLDLDTCLECARRMKINPAKVALWSF